MENFNLLSIKKDKRAYVHVNSFAVMPDGFISLCLLCNTTGFGRFSFLNNRWKLNADYKTEEDACRFLYKNQVVAQIRPIEELNFDSEYNYTVIPNLRHFLDVGEEMHYLCSHLNMDKEWNAEPVEITKDLADYYVKDPNVKRRKIYYTDCVLVKVGDYIGTLGHEKINKAWYGFTIKNGKYYFLGKMKEEDGKAYGKGSKLVEAVKKYNEQIEQNVPLSRIIDLEKALFVANKENQELKNFLYEANKRALKYDTELQELRKLPQPCSCYSNKNGELLKQITELTMELDNVKQNSENHMAWLAQANAREMKYRQDISDLNKELNAKRMEINQLTALNKNLKYHLDSKTEQLNNTIEKNKQEKTINKEQVALELSNIIKNNIFHALNLEEPKED